MSYISEVKFDFSLTVLQDALVARSLEGSTGCRTFTLCCDGLDLQPVQTGSVQARQHHKSTVLKDKEERMKTYKTVSNDQGV